MKLYLSAKAALALIAGACILFASASEAAVSYHVTVDTSSLIGSLSAPFALDFQFNNGGGSLSNTAIVSNFDFGGGNFTTVPFAPTTFGLAVGSLASSISLTADSSNAFNEFYQGFNPGSVLQFDVILTTNINTPAPDAFVFSILDNSLHSIDTNGAGDELLLIELSSITLAAQTFPSVSSPFVTLAAVPEPATALFGVALFGICSAARRRRSS